MTFLTRVSSAFLVAALSLAGPPIAAAFDAQTVEGRAVAQWSGATLSPPSGSLCSPSDSDFDGYRYREQVAHCKRDVSTKLKQRIKARHGIAPEDYGNYEVDHFIPLGLGGDNSIDNLWPLPHHLAREKSQLEQQLHNQLQSGSITQAEAIRIIRRWRPSRY